jgi:hypothetical protein
MRIGIFKAKCVSCHSEFSYPDLGDQNYGNFLFTGEKGNVFAHFAALGHPVWEFIKSVFSEGGDTKKRVEIGARIQAACAYVADPIKGQKFVNHHVCPVCQSTKWAWWGGDNTGSLEVPEVTYQNFESLSEPERRKTIIEFINKAKA